jgi:two-component system, OmpR family, response regulator
VPDCFFNEHPEKDIDILKGVRIIVVDDTESCLLLITYILESYGIKVITADNANSALEMIKLFHVDVLISDIAMSGESGYWLIQKVRSLSHPQKREIPAIAFTGNTEAKAQEQALVSGFQTYLPKPSSHIQLITEVAKCLSSRRG